MHAPNHRFAHVPGWLSTAHEQTPVDDPDAIRRMRMLRAMPLLQAMRDDALWRLACGAAERTFSTGDIVHEPGGSPDELRACVVTSGCCDIITDAASDTEQVAGCLAQHDWFGDIGVMSAAPHHARIRAAGHEPVSVFEFDAVMFQGIVAEQLLITKVMRRVREVANDAPIDIRELGVFSDLPIRDLGTLLADARQERHVPGATIINQGDPGDRLHVILHGEVSVERDSNELARLHRGEYFGETALIFDCPRTATVRAVRESTTWSISRDTFHTIVRFYLLEQTQSRDSIASRMRNTA